MKIIINVKAYLADGNCVINHDVVCDNSIEEIQQVEAYEIRQAFGLYKVVRMTFDIAFPQ